MQPRCLRFQACTRPQNLQNFRISCKNWDGNQWTLEDVWRHLWILVLRCSQPQQPRAEFASSIAKSEFENTCRNEIMHWAFLALHHIRSWIKNRYSVFRSRPCLRPQTSFVRTFRKHYKLGSRVSWWLLARKTMHVGHTKAATGHICVTSGKKVFLNCNLAFMAGRNEWNHT